MASCRRTSSNTVRSSARTTANPATARPTAIGSDARRAGHHDPRPRRLAEHRGIEADATTQRHEREGGHRHLHGRRDDQHDGDPQRRFVGCELGDQAEVERQPAGDADQAEPDEAASSRHRSACPARGAGPGRAGVSSGASAVLSKQTGGSAVGVEQLGDVLGEPLAWAGSVTIVRWSASGMTCRVAVGGQSPSWRRGAGRGRLPVIRRAARRRGRPADMMRTGASPRSVAWRATEASI
jgi:hypothetical protein